MERLAGRIILLWGWRAWALAFLAGAVAVLGLPPFDFFLAPFVSFPILVWLLDGASGNPASGPIGRARPAFAIGWWFGFGYFVAGLWWLGGAFMVEADAFAWAIPLAVLGLPAVLALFFGVASVLARPLWSGGIGRIAALAACLGLTDWLRGVLFTGFPWNAIGYLAMPAPLAMQSVAIVGVAGVGTLAVLVFAMPALLGTRQGLRAGTAIALVLTAAHLGFGAFALSRTPANGSPAADNPVIRIVQPSIPQAAKWDEAERDEIFRTHLDLTTRPVAEGEPEPTHIVWAETAVPFILTEAPDALAAIAESLQPGQTLAAGAIRIERGSGTEPPRYYNSITVIDDGGQITAAADKVHLVPFGEYLPFEETLQRFGISPVAAGMASFSAAGERRPLAFGNGLSVLPLICYEAIFPIGRPPAGDAPDLILNVTNDGWYGNTPGPYQHFRQAQVRAVEAGLPLVRVANNGISAMVDHHGRIIDGLALDAVGVVDIRLDEPAVPIWDVRLQEYNPWLLIAILLLIALVARSGFIRRSIDGNP